jgi:hypothetical protein
MDLWRYLIYPYLFGRWKLYLPAAGRTPSLNLAGSTQLART